MEDRGPSSVKDVLGPSLTDRIGRSGMKWMIVIPVSAIYRWMKKILKRDK